MTVIPATAPSPAAATTSTSTPASAPPTGTSNSNSLVNENTFLQLLVAQLQNQDPLNPDQQSGTQMVSELAQFSELEQVMGIGQNVQTITTDIGSQTAAAATSSSPTSNAGSTGASAT
jgi:flagellar basal-body rod modification protein FlgD